MQITHEAERHLSQPKKEDNDVKDDDKGSSKDGKSEVRSTGLQIKCLKRFHKEIILEHM